jgi:hypothetical protein
MITTANFNDLVKNAKYSWTKARDDFGSIRNLLADVVSVTEKTSSHSGISGTPTARRRDEGDDAYKGTVKQDYTKTFTQAEIALQVDVTKQLRMFDKYDEIMKRMYNMGRGAERRLELDLASLLYSAWASSYTNMDGETVTTTTPDGVVLISPSHTCNGSSSTWSNEISTTHDPISTDTFEALEEKFNGFLDADGRNVPVIPDTVITGRHAPTVHIVRRILLSDNLQGTTDNDKNTLKTNPNGMAYRHLIVPFLDVTPSTEARNSSMARYCFLAALNNKYDRGFRIEMSQDVKFEAPEQVFESGTWEFMTTALYDFGTLFANFMAGTKGDSSAV